MFYAEEDKQASVMEAMSGLLHVPFRFENGGTRVIFYDPEQWLMKS